MANEQKLARFLGWFSLGLGLAQLGATQGLSEMIGIKYGRRSRTALRSVGLREVTAGMGILLQSRPTPWVWSRVAGDIMDLALLGRAFNSGNNNRQRLMAATATATGIALLDLGCSLQLTRGRGKDASTLKENNAMQVRKAVTINKSPEELYTFWHDFQNLPRFMRHLESVEVLGPNRSHWKAKAPAGKTVEWDAEITEDRPNELISWRSVDGADIPNAGTVRFVPAPGDRGTQVRVEMQYDLPGGPVASMVAKLTGEEPEVQVEDDLLVFKQVMELGEVVLSDGTLYTTHPIQRPAQPPADGEAGASA